MSGVLIERWRAHLRQRGYSPTSIKSAEDGGAEGLLLLTGYSGVAAGVAFGRVKLSYGRVEQLPRALSAREIAEAPLTGPNNNSSAVALVMTGASRLDSVRASSARISSPPESALVDLLFARVCASAKRRPSRQDFFVRESVFRVKGKAGRDRLAVVVSRRRCASSGNT